MRRADRLFRLVQELRGGRLVTARTLAERMEVSERTIYRDVADLAASGVPIDGAAGLGYVMRTGFDLPPLMFTRAEIAALVTGARLVRAWGGAGMAGAAETALGKIAAVLPDGVRDAPDRVAVHAFRPAEMDAPLRDRLDRLERAADERTRLAIAYADEAGRRTDRTIRPLGLWFWGKVWTLVAWCELRRDFRIFRADRIAAIEPAGPFREEPGKRLTDFYARDCAQDLGGWTRPE